MTKWVVRTGAVAAIIVTLLSATAPARAQALLIRNVHGYTPAASGIDRFTSMLIVDGRVSQISDGDIPVPAGTATIDGSGKTLLPGLIDAHGHVLGMGEEQLQVDLRGTASLADALRRVGTFAKSDSKEPWLRGRGWNQVLWSGGEFPTAKDLDAVVSNRPAILSRVDGHAIWVNTQALQLAGITAVTKDPAGGQIVRDAQGQPTGVLVDAAMPLVANRIPAASDITVKRALATSMRELVKVGLTGAHDAGIDARTYRMYQQLGASGELPMRIYAMLADGPAARKLMAAAPKQPQFEQRLQMRAVKAVVDGALGSRGAALLADYSDQPGHRGLLLYTPQQLQTLGKLTAANGWQLNVHAIGDAANRLVLDTFESTHTEAQRKTLRPRIEHAQIISAVDIPRFASLSVIASIQPTHATSDMNMAEARVGTQRMQGAYAWRKLIDAGVRLAGGSDFPVELPNPFHGLYSAVTRQDHDGKPPGGWYGEQKLTREEALRLFTIDAAYAAHMERGVGSLEAGKWADFILIDRDYFTIDESEIDDIRVLATYVAGRKVSESDSSILRSGRTALAAL